LGINTFITPLKGQLEEILEVAKTISCALDVRREMVAEMLDTCYVGPNPSNPPSEKVKLQEKMKKVLGTKVYNSAS
jgi:hypothetical protein